MTFNVTYGVLRQIECQRIKYELIKHHVIYRYSIFKLILVFDQFIFYCVAFDFAYFNIHQRIR